MELLIILGGGAVALACTAYVAYQAGLDHGRRRPLEYARAAQQSAIDTNHELDRLRWSSMVELLEGQP